MGTTRDWWPGELMGNQQCCHSYGWIGNAIILLDSGIPYSCSRWHQVSLKLNALPENVELTIPQPKATEVYYRTCGVIDQHNRHGQDN